jgi:predicted helicase
MSEKKLAKIFYADLWGLRSKKYKYLLENDVKTTKWQELKPTTPYYFFVPKDFALQAEYDKFWKVTEIFKEWSSGVTTHRDHFVVGFTKEEILQRLRIFTGRLPDELVAQSLNLKDTGTWKLAEARQKIRDQRPEDKIYPYAYRPFDMRIICYEPTLIDRPRLPFMNNLKKKNIALLCMREVVIESGFSHIFVGDRISDRRMFLSNRGAPYFFSLYLYPDEPERRMFDDEAHKADSVTNFTPEFLQTVKDSLGKEPEAEEIFYYIYAVLYSPTYRKRYEEFLKIDFPQVPLPSNNEAFKELNSLGKELVELHLLKHSSLADSEVGFPKGGSNMMEKVVYDEQNQIVFINKEQYFEGISKEVWKYQIGAYQVLEKYLKDRKSRKLSLDEIDHYMKMAKAIRLTIVLQEKIDEVYRKIEI